MKERWHIIFVNLKVLLDSIITPWSINVIVNIEVPLKVKFPNFNQLLFELSVVEINLIAFDEYLLTWKLIWKFSTSEYLVKMYNIFMIYYRFLGKLTAHNLASFKSEYVKFIMLLSAFIRLIPFNASLVHICSLFFFFLMTFFWLGFPANFGLRESQGYCLHYLTHSSSLLSKLYHGIQECCLLFLSWRNLCHALCLWCFSLPLLTF